MKEMNCYECSDARVSFGKNFIYVTPNYRINSQEILFDGGVIGLLQEREIRSIVPIDALEVSFNLFVDEEIDDARYVEDEWEYMSFTNLQECIDWYLMNKDKVNTHILD